jgi:hypothetical protein
MAEFKITEITTCCTATKVVINIATQLTVIFSIQKGHLCVKIDDGRGSLATPLGPF